MSTSEKSKDTSTDYDINKIKEIQDQYYSTNKKNTFFKNKQKIDCANYICNYIPIEYLISQTVFVAPNTNEVYIDYTIFKLFANPENYKTIVKKIVDYAEDRVGLYNNFQIHMNLDSLTVSAVERYKDAIKFFVEHCISSQTDYSNKMSHMYIYNPPKCFDHIIKILKPFIETNIYNKIILCDDKTSIEKVTYFTNIRDSSS